MGRPRKLTPAIHTAIVNAVAAGVSLSAAAELVEVDAITAQQWVKRGLGLHASRSQIEPYVGFAQAVMRARAQDEARRIARIEQAGRGGHVIYRKTILDQSGRQVVEERLTPPDWAADAWHLERSRPQEWGRKDRVDIKLQIEELAAKVAAEMGLTKEEVLAEAQALLAEGR